MGVRGRIRQFVLRTMEKRQIRKYEELYGEFDRNNYNSFSVYDLPSESRFYWGELIKWSADINPQCVLFAGENRSTAQILKNKINAGKVLTTGLQDVDYEWNFEEDHPVIEEEVVVDLIVSQAILEHLLNPYKHLHDLSNLVSNKGHIIIHTVMPGFPYHRHPIDALRFFPDWFEEAAKRFNLRIVRKRIYDTHIFYMYQKV